MRQQREQTSEEGRVKEGEKKKCTPEYKWLFKHLTQSVLLAQLYKEVPSSLSVALGLFVFIDPPPFPAPPPPPPLPLLNIRGSVGGLAQPQEEARDGSKRREGGRWWGSAKGLVGPTIY